MFPILHPHLRHVINGGIVKPRLHHLGIKGGVVGTFSKGGRGESTVLCFIIVNTSYKLNLLMFNTFSPLVQY